MSTLKSNTRTDGIWKSAGTVVEALNVNVTTGPAATKANKRLISSFVDSKRFLVSPPAVAHTCVRGTNLVEVGAQLRSMLAPLQSNRCRGHGGNLEGNGITQVALTQATHLPTFFY